MIIRLLVATCALGMALAPVALAKPKSAQTRTVAVQETANGNSLVAGGKYGFAKQDLFDRLNRMNIRTDWPAPPAQPGQF